MTDPQEAATPSDPHSAEAEEREAWAAFVAGHASRDAEVAELKAKMADAVEALSTPMDLTKVLDTHQGRALWKANQADAALKILGQP